MCAADFGLNGRMSELNPSRTGAAIAARLPTRSRRRHGRSSAALETPDWPVLPKRCPARLSGKPCNAAAAGPFLGFTQLGFWVFDFEFLLREYPETARVLPRGGRNLRLTTLLLLLLLLLLEAGLVKP